MNPFTKQIQHYPIKPGQVANVPQAWWHYEVATVDNTHLLAIFNAPTPEVVHKYDILKLTPANIIAHTYCMEENQWKKTIEPVNPSLFIGPPKECERESKRTAYHNTHYVNYSSTTPINISLIINKTINPPHIHSIIIKLLEM